MPVVTPSGPALPPSCLYLVRNGRGHDEVDIQRIGPTLLGFGAAGVSVGAFHDQAIAPDVPGCVTHRPLVREPPIDILLADVLAVEVPAYDEEIVIERRGVPPFEDEIETFGVRGLNGLRAGGG